MFNKDRIVEEIASLASNTEVTLIDATLVVAERHELEIDVVAQLISSTPHLFYKMKDDAIKLHLIVNDEEEDDVLF